MNSDVTDAGQYDGPPYLGAVLHGDKVLGAAIRTPPWRLVLSLFDHPGAVHKLAADVVDADLPGWVGPAEPAAHFAEAWRELTGASARLATHERAFRLRAVTPPPPAPGTMRRAVPEELPLLATWAEAFHDEALRNVPAMDFELMAQRWIEGIGRTAYVWDDEGQAVSLACVGGPTPHGIRVGPVYTPPEARGRGYASSLVAGVSQLQLDDGKEFVFLFTDLANPTSNKIYQAIGFEPVIDVDEWELD